MRWMLVGPRQEWPAEAAVTRALNARARARRTPEGSTGTCGHCQDEITLLGGTWTDPDGCTNCLAASTTAAYHPHEPQEGS